MLRKWWKPAAVVLLGAVALFVWQCRVPVIVTADGDLQWSGASTPPTREIAWTGAEEIDSVLPDAESSAQMITPRFSDNGNTLYFTLRRDGGQSDLYFAERSGSKWQAAKPIATLNTDADELGPSLSSDGDTLWFYSNREGGQGGYDLYFATRDGDDWSEAWNAGPAINSVGHEYDPALSPDGQTLFFASNRTDEMLKAVDAAKAQNAPWETTLRARLSRAKFDLFRATRDVDGAWQTAAALSSLNRPRSNEGAPFVSPNGVYLYFASDRPARQGEDSNLDIYRIRLAATDAAELENLGPTINSEHHETEPALSAEGFTLIFSSDRDGVDRLYRSRAEEVVRRTDWLFPAIPQWLKDVWLTALAITLVVAAVFGAIMHWRGLMGEQAYRARFLLSSLALHLLLIALLAWWTLPQVMEVIMAELEVEGPAMTPFEDTADVESPDPREAYEKVQDLAPVEDAAPIQPVQRQNIAQQQPRPAEPIENPLPDLPQTVSHAVDPARIAYVPAERPPVIEQPELARNMTPLQTELVTIEELPELDPIEEPVPEQPAPQQTPVEVARQDTAAERPDIPRRTVPSEVMELAAATAELVEPEFTDTPTVDTPTNQPQPTRQKPVLEIAQAELPELPDLPNLEPAPESPTQPQPAATDLNRASATAPQINAPSLTEPVATLPGLTGPQPTTANVPVANSTPDVSSPVTPQQRPQFERAIAEPIEVAGIAVNEEILSPEVVETSAVGMLVAIDASVPRNTPISPKAGSPQSTNLESPATSQPAALSIAAVQQPISVDVQAPTERIQRRGPTAPLLAEAPVDPAIAALEATESSDGQLASVEQAAVNLDRRSEVTQPSTVRSPLKRKTDPVPELTVVALDAPEKAPVDDVEFTIDRPVSAPVQRRRGEIMEVALADPLEDIELADAPAAATSDATETAATEIQVTRSTTVAVTAATQRPVLLARSNLAARAMQVALAEPIDDPLVSNAPELQAQRSAPAVAELAETELDPEAVALATTDDVPMSSPERVAVAVERQQQPMQTTVERTPMSESVSASPDLHVDAKEAITRSLIRETEFAIERSVSESLTRDSRRQFEVAVADAAEATLADPRTATEPTMDDEAPEEASFSRSDIPVVEVKSQPTALARTNVSAENFEVAVATTGSLIDLLPDPTVPSDGLTRQALHPMTLAASQDTVELRSMFTLRKAENRKNLIDLLGGTPQSELAVNRGLDWLAKVQEEDGSWSLKKHQGQVKSHCAATGFGLLPFLAAGHTHNQPGKYQQVVKKALDWMIENQDDDGNLMLKSDDQHNHMYSHGIGSIALCEAFGVSSDDALREPAQKALDFIVKAQHGAGGWRYRPGEAGDTSVVGWQMMALKSGEMAGLQVPTQTYARVTNYLNSVEDQKNNGGRFGYTNRSANLTMTAEGLLCLQFLGTTRNDSRMRAGAEWLLRELPEQQQKRTSYYWYYATQVMYHMQGDYWEQWNGRLRDMLVKSQKQSGGNAGSWDPRDNWDQKGGRIMATSMKLLMLEVYYRHLPLYDQLDD